jgi:hypothetical protein
MAKLARGLAHERRRLRADGLHQLGQGHGADERVKAHAAPVLEGHGLARGRHRRHARAQRKLPFQQRQEAVHERLETAAQRIAEARVGADGFLYRLQRALDHFLQVGQRHASAQPRGFHLAQRHGPQLAVVGNGEVLGHAAAPDLVDEFLEIARCHRHMGQGG